MLKNRWIPPENYQFPASNKRNLKFQRKWLVEFPWLTYSKKLDGAICQHCCLFGSKQVGKGGHAPVQSLVITPFTRWKDAKENFRHHEALQYHNNAVVSSQHFIDVEEKRIMSISLQLDKARNVEIEQNRKILSSIIETVIFAGRQDIAFRGHRDSGPILSEMPLENDGNF